MKIALIGNPNSGKTSLFNLLTGSNQRVGNWAGVTVSKKTGVFTYEKQAFQVVDLPGVYSLSVVSNESSLDEQIACDFILSGEVDVVINILDASNLERNLYLTLQLLEMQVPMILVLNMVDVAKAQGVFVDPVKLEQLLGCPVLSLNSRKGHNISELKQCILAQNFRVGHPVIYGAEVEKKLGALVQQLTEHEEIANARWFAIRLIERDYCAHQFLSEQPTIASWLEAQEQAFSDQQGYSLEVGIAEQRYSNIAEIATQVKKELPTRREHFTTFVDKIVLNRYLGIPIFLLIMYLMFEFSIALGGVLQPLFDQGSRTLFINGFMYLGHEIGLPLWLSAVLGQGVGLGLNTVLTFIPQIGAMFLFLSLVEDSGYMARAAFVMDRLMQWVGLPGKSFVPLIVGFGCNVPSILATRTLESRRDRLVTILMAPFISCGARLAIFAVFAAAFFPRGGASVVFLLYIIGIAVAILTGLVVKKTMLKGKPAPFVMELPAYHLPNAKALWMSTWQRLKRFIFRAGKVIIPVCVLVGTLNTVLPNGDVVPGGSRQSVLSEFGQMITPVLAPMGIQQDNWPATVGLITGGLAKEVVVGTLNTLYTQRQNIQGFEPEQYSLWAGLKSALRQTYDGFKNLDVAAFANPFTANEADHHMGKGAMGHMVVAFGSGLSAFVYLLFVLLYVPCVSTVAVTVREVGRAFGVISTLWSLSVAYVLSVMLYQGATMLSHPISSLAWLLGCVVYMVVLIWGLQFWSQKAKLSEHSVQRRCPVNCRGCK